MTTTERCVGEPDFVSASDRPYYVPPTHAATPPPSRPTSPTLPHTIQEVSYGMAVGSCVVDCGAADLGDPLPVGKESCDSSGGDDSGPSCSGPDCHDERWAKVYDERHRRYYLQNVRTKEKKWAQSGDGDGDGLGAAAPMEMPACLFDREPEVLTEEDEIDEYLFQVRDLAARKEEEAALAEDRAAPSDPSHAYDTAPTVPTGTDGA